ncbi:MAG: hypothetical protein ACHQ7M_23100, partial [Chloroflexota bacterium]
MSRQGCSCCPGGEHQLAIWNAAGKDEIDYRLGRQPDFFEAAVKRLSGPDYPSLAGLTSRELSDPSIALLDAWAMLADITTFY